MMFTMNGSKQSAIVMKHHGALTIIRDGRVIHLHLPDPSISVGEAAGSGRVTAPMPGRIVTVLVGQGDTVKKDQPLLVMEAMKMEMTIRAGCDGTVDELPVAANDQVTDGALLVMIAS
jgi:3-methylcrotonyl-CoA carboxylase alpha subunit